MNYKTEQEKQDERFEELFSKLKIYNSDNEGGYDAKLYLSEYLLSRDTALLEAIMKDVGEMVVREQEKLKEYPMWNEFVRGENESFELLLSLLKDYKLNK